MPSNIIVGGRANLDGNFIGYNIAVTSNAKSIFYQAPLTNDVVRYRLIAIIVKQGIVRPENERFYVNKKRSNYIESKRPVGAFDV